ncbi:MAG TPA: GTP-dependent dephospho-CoA kinase family protein [Nitrososphaeraceae archaeon]|jgi:GTP-dependent dephospho-CoA kinase|nr:GTP-dependent dephospho-CoA kinase family protein [Nitrososphaeraceae archaeon]
MPLNDEHINILKKPFGSLINQKNISKEKIVNLIKETNIIITVGDATTEKIISYGIMPNLGIIDGIERRIKRSERDTNNLMNTFLKKNHSYNQYRCKNSKGTISREAYLTIRKILLQGQKAIIFIDGEEDLLALPVFALSPVGSLVLYGQPLEGIVIVKINDEIKLKSTNLIKNIGIE